MIHSILLRVFFFFLYYTLIEDSSEKHKCHSCYKIFTAVVHIVKRTSQQPTSHNYYVLQLPVRFLKLSLLNFVIYYFTELWEF